MAGLLPMAENPLTQLNEGLRAGQDRALTLRKAREEVEYTEQANQYRLNEAKRAEEQAEVDAVNRANIDRRVAEYDRTRGQIVEAYKAGDTALAESLGRSIEGMTVTTDASGSSITTTDPLTAASENRARDALAENRDVRTELLQQDGLTNQEVLDLQAFYGADALEISMSGGPTGNSWTVKVKDGYDISLAEIKIRVETMRAKQLEQDYQQSLLTYSSELYKQHTEGFVPEGAYEAAGYKDAMDYEKHLSWIEGQKLWNQESQVWLDKYEAVFGRDNFWTEWNGKDRQFINEGDGGSFRAWRKMVDFHYENFNTQRSDYAAIQKELIAGGGADIAPHVLYARYPYVKPEVLDVLQSLSQLQAGKIREIDFATFVSEGNERYRWNSNLIRYRGEVQMAVNDAKVSGAAVDPEDQRRLDYIAGINEEQMYSQVEMLGSIYSRMTTVLAITGDENSELELEDEQGNLIPSELMELTKPGGEEKLFESPEAATQFAYLMQDGRFRQSMNEFFERWDQGDIRANIDVFAQNFEQLAKHINERYQQTFNLDLLFTGQPEIDAAAAQHLGIPNDRALNSNVQPSPETQAAVAGTGGATDGPQFPVGTIEADGQIISPSDLGRGTILYIQHGPNGEKKYVYAQDPATGDVVIAESRTPVSDEFYGSGDHNEAADASSEEEEGGEPEAPATPPASNNVTQIPDNYTTASGGSPTVFPEGHAKAGEYSELTFSPLQNTLVQAANAAGVNLQINSASRNSVTQQRLYDTHLAGGPLAAQPGSSRHETGDAVDIQNWQEVEPFMNSQGWERNLPTRDPVHFVYTGRRTPMPAPVDPVAEQNETLKEDKDEVRQGEDRWIGGSGGISSGEYGAGDSDTPKPEYVTAASRVATEMADRLAENPVPGSSHFSTEQLHDYLRQLAMVVIKDDPTKYFVPSNTPGEEVDLSAIADEQFLNTVLVFLGDRATPQSNN